MKTLYLLLFLFAATLTGVNAQTQVNDLSIFLGKLQACMVMHPRYTQPKMPIAKPDTPTIQMHSLNATGYMEDPTTKLRYYAAHDKIVALETRYAFHVASMQIS